MTSYRPSEILLSLVFGALFIHSAVSQDSVIIQAVPLEQETLLAPVAEKTSEPASPDEWWTGHVRTKMRTETAAKQLTLHELMWLALKNSAQIQVYSEVPLIRETAVQEADAAFDWTGYMNSMWEDNNVPVGSALTLGGAGNRFLDHNLTAQSGAKRRVQTGGQFDISQKLGWQGTNSNFFVPNDQGTARLLVGFTQPLLRGQGAQYNTSLQVLTRIDVETADQEFLRQLQSHLLEISRGYWALYLERGSLAQKTRLFNQTREILELIESRQTVDTQRSQLISVRAALENRRTDLIRSLAATKNAETRLRALVNSSELGSDDEVELIPVEFPSSEWIETDPADQLASALQHRPEIQAAVREVRASCIRLDMAKNEMLPMLNAVTQMYLSGLQGNYDVGQSMVDQFSTGKPSYSVGLQYEKPFGNRAAKARQDRRRLEVRQLQEQYRGTVENVRAEVIIAVRELETSFQELQARQHSLMAAVNEAETIEARWKRLADANGMANLNLESLLRAQERVTETEYQLLQSQLTYNFAMINLQRANGTLLEMEQIWQADICEDGLPRRVLDRSSQSPTSFSELPVETPVPSAKSTSTISQSGN